MSRLLVPLALVGLTGCFVQLHQDDGIDAIEEPFSRVVVEVETGSVEIYGGSSDITEVDWDMRWGMGCPEVDSYVWDETLYIVGECPKGGFGCSTDFRITVPSGVDIEARIVTGELVAEDVGSVTAELTTGELQVFQAEGDIDLEVTTGSIIAQDLRSERVRAELTTGSMDLMLDSEFAEVEADLVTGDITLAVPEGCYDLDLDVVTGDVESWGVGCDCSAEGSIHARVVTGSILVRGE